MDSYNSGKIKQLEHENDRLLHENDQLKGLNEKYKGQRQDAIDQFHHLAIKAKETATKKNNASTIDESVYDPNDIDKVKRALGRKKDSDQTSSSAANPHVRTAVIAAGSGGGVKNIAEATNSSSSSTGQVSKKTAAKKQTEMSALDGKGTENRGGTQSLSAEGTSSSNSKKMTNADVVASNKQLAPANIVKPEDDEVIGLLNSNSNNKGTQGGAAQPQLTSNDQQIAAAAELTTPQIVAA